MCCRRVPGKEAAAIRGQWLLPAAAPRLPWGKGGSGRGASTMILRRRRRMTMRPRAAAEAGQLEETGAATATAMATARSPVRRCLMVLRRALGNLIEERFANANLVE
jgi:hypothetical protein